MASLTHSVSDGLTMFRRNLKRAIRYPGLTIFVVFIPVVFLLLFVYVFGGALGAGIVPGGGQEDYLEFVVTNRMPGTTKIRKNGSPLMAIAQKPNSVYMIAIRPGANVDTALPRQRFTDM